MHRLADAVKGGELSYMALAMEREQTTYSSVLGRLYTVQADPKPMLACLVRVGLALSCIPPAWATARHQPP